jgi:hypothetical protein
MRDTSPCNLEKHAFHAMAASVRCSGRMYAALSKLRYHVQLINNHLFKIATLLRSRHDEFGMSRTHEGRIRFGISQEHP